MTLGVKALQFSPTRRSMRREDDEKPVEIQLQDDDRDT